MLDSLVNSTSVLDIRCFLFPVSLFLAVGKLSMTYSVQHHESFREEVELAELVVLLQEAPIKALFAAIAII